MPCRSTRIAVTAALTLAAAGAASAQPAQYRRLPGDTLRYYEGTQSNAVLRAEQGTFPLTTTQESLVSVTFPREGEAVAWFDSLSIRGSSVAGDAAPATGGVLGRPYVLRFGPRGPQETLRTPDFPLELDAVTDLRKQFDEFFLRLPAKPLRPGLAWSDSTTAVDSLTAGARGTFTRVGRYRVRGDTTVNGVRGLAVDAVVRLHVLTVAGATPERPRLRSELLGEERGVVVIDARGVMLARERTAGLAGEVVMGEPGTAQTMQQSIRYRGTITLVAGP